MTSNDLAQQQGRLERQYAAKRDNAGPVRCGGWFGPLMSSMSTTLARIS
jgi:hypothetical protein